jgi:phosphoribosylaminoimidazole-succinocarboxamide synthase
MSAKEAVVSTHIPGLKIFRKGKVRDVYDLGDKLLIVATDRISAFDVVMPNGITDKGRVLTAMSLFWFEFTEELVENHLIATNVDDYPEELKPHRELLEGRSMLVKKTEPFPVECVARGYIIGGGWKDYQETGEVCGIRLPEGLEQAQRLPGTIFTPATKAEEGHDENIPFEVAAEIVGQETAEELREITIKLYDKAREYAEGQGIIIADTKFEFGMTPNGIILIDEILTPDSSRFWPADKYQTGTSPESFDKQFVRDYLEQLDWDKTPPAPVLPDEIVEKTRAKYVEAYELLTGRKFV